VRCVTRPTCNHPDGCDSLAESRGLCSTHYAAVFAVELAAESCRPECIEDGCPVAVPVSRTVGIMNAGDRNRAGRARKRARSLGLVLVQRSPGEADVTGPVWRVYACPRGRPCFCPPDTEAHRLIFGEGTAGETLAAVEALLDDVEGQSRALDERRRGSKQADPR
jgi:hypothetical protein